jgi:hypothetical protein
MGGLEADLSMALSRLRRYPDDDTDLEIPYLRMGPLARRQLRRILADAKAAGVDVIHAEQRGWLTSVFSVRVMGEARQVEGTVLRLLWLTRSAGLDD